MLTSPARRLGTGLTGSKVDEQCVVKRIKPEDLVGLEDSKDKTQGWEVEMLSFLWYRAAVELEATRTVWGCFSRVCRFHLQGFLWNMLGANVPNLSGRNVPVCGLKRKCNLLIRGD